MLLLLVFVLFLTDFKKMKSGDYNKVREVTIEECNEVGLNCKVTISKLYCTSLEIPTYNVDYICYDGRR